jgi:hypothetical protein
MFFFILIWDLTIFAISFKMLNYSNLNGLPPSKAAGCRESDCPGFFMHAPYVN